MWKQERGHNRNWWKFGNEVLYGHYLPDLGKDVRIKNRSSSNNIGGCGPDLSVSRLGPVVVVYEHSNKELYLVVHHHLKQNCISVHY